MVRALSLNIARFLGSDFLVSNTIRVGDVPSQSLVVRLGLSAITVLAPTRIPVSYTHLTLPTICSV